jgi:replication factor C large subunit
MILIANDLYALSPEIRSRCEPVQFKAVQARTIVPRLKYLCSAEKVRCSDAALRVIAESAEGDIRSAVNILYASAIGRDTLEDDGIHTSQKDERVSIFTLITALFQKTPDAELMRLSREVEDTPDTIEQWVEGSVHLIPDISRTELAYRYLSRADEYLGYTYRRQYHTLWRYATAIMLLGVADAAGGKGLHTRITPPERWQKMATAKKQKSIRTSTLNRVAGMMHIPQNTLREHYLGIVSLLIEHDPAGFARDFLFDSDQLNFFLSDRARSATVMKTLAQEEKPKEKEQIQESQQKKKREKNMKSKAAPEQKTEEQPVKKEPAVPKETEEKRSSQKSQSTLFDGF